jgi:hypothetical protein
MCSVQQCTAWPAGVQTPSDSTAAQLALLQLAVRRAAAPLAAFAAAELRAAAADAAPQMPPVQPLSAPYLQGTPRYCSALPVEPGALLTGPVLASHICAGRHARQLIRRKHEVRVCVPALLQMV